MATCVCPALHQQDPTQLMPPAMAKPIPQRRTPHERPHAHQTRSTPPSPAAGSVRDEHPAEASRAILTRRHLSRHDFADPVCV
ncbi:hypothetical protein BV25DRAFT_1917881 [Artomyces pyxidatus]|uniref:Uncharacterized protein n=1 Tax=Artomyces pyxidatus TaxID=48021 RepID=A0ACB8SVP1_9AGAM|nr:hypothetical protein BV25DRAFT_1917881 [Artomyces pyxidatus]